MKSEKDSRSPDELVLVIHGVGDPAPGETLNLFARSVAADGLPLVDQQEIVWLPDKTPNANRVETFAAHINRLKFGTRTGMLAEIFWGDLSRVRRGVLGAVMGLIEILFGMRYVSYVAAYQPGWATSLLRRIGLMCFNILHGPVLAITFFLMLMTLALLGTELMWPASYKGVVWSRIVMCSVCALAFLLTQIGDRVTENTGVKQFWFWVLITNAFITGLMVVKTIFIDVQRPDLAFTGAVQPGLIWYCQVLVSMLALFWIMEMLMIISMGLCWVAALFSSPKHRTALHVAFLLPAMSIGFWGLVLPMCWLTAAHSLKKFKLLEDFNNLFQQAMPLLGIQFIMALFLIVGAVIVLSWYFLWRIRTLKKGLETASDPPRLIVHEALQFAAAISTLMGVSMVAIIGIMQFSGERYEDIWGGKSLAEANKYSAMAMAPLGLVVFMLFPHLRPALDIILDVINHFFFRATRVADAIDDDEFDITEATLESGSLYFARRDAVHLRIKKTLAFFRDELESRPNLTIISHSQGTMIAIEALNDPELSWLNSSFSRVRLITMGSPFTHLYQHYFQHLYPSLDDEFWNPLHGRLDKWINIFRRDDFVGTRIDFCVEHKNFLAKYVNYPVGMRGHLNYWNDREVLDIVEAELGIKYRKQESPVELRRAA